MKKILLFLTAALLINLVGFSTIFAATCDQSFNGGMLRYNKTYQFYDVWNNNGSATDYMNSVYVNYNDGSGWSPDGQAATVWPYFDPGTDFQWTQQLKNAGYGVPGFSSMEIVNSGPTNWRIKSHPTTRTSGTIGNHDFGLRYKVNYDNSNNYPNTSDDKIHTECVYYSVTWCGDGVRDSGYEVCDPNDSSQSGWGAGGCDNSCQPIDVPTPTTCDGITVTPSTGTAPFITTVSCSATNASIFQIQCGNGSVLNDQSGTCSYPVGSDYTAKCIVDGSITSPACEQVVRVKNPTPHIRVDKEDANTNDIDGITGNDTQTVLEGEDAVFKIRVTNVGEETLKDIVLLDPAAPTCATKSGTYVNLSEKKFTNVNNSNVTITFGGSGNHGNNTLEVDEWFEYTCKKPNTQSAYINEVTTRGTGITSGVRVSDYNKTEVKLIEPNIQVIKVDKNSADEDGVQGNDTQTVLRGNDAVFEIIVTNNGTENLKNIVLTDALAPVCDSNGDYVNLSGKKFTNKNGKVVSILFSGNGNHNDNILQIGEVFRYTCEKGDTQNNYTNEVTVNGVGVDSGVGVNDNDLSKVLVQDVPENDYDLALRKTLKASTPGPFGYGETVAFKIEVFNQGDVVASNIEVTDYIPTGLTLVDIDGWILSGDKATRTINTINPKQSKSLTITFTIDDGAPKGIMNFAEISNDDGDDCDSIPDNVNGNQDGEAESTGLIDNNIGSECINGVDEDDHDIETITVVDPIYDLALRKIADDLICELFEDCEDLKAGDEVTFSIEVYNQGNIDSGFVEITDYIPNGFTPKPGSNPEWSFSGDIATIGIVNIPADGRVIVSITFTIDEGAPKTISNYAEISDDSGDDCDSTHDQIVGNDKLTDDLIRPGCIIDADDEDDHDIETIIVEKGKTDVVLIKELAVGQSDIVIPGDSVDYTITVTNYGSGAALNQEVFDYFESDELILSDTDWTLVEAGKAKYNTLLNLNPGESIDIDITFTVAPNAQGTIINLACVGSEDDPDCVPDPCDLTPDGLCCDETHEDYDADGCEPIHTPDVVLIKELAVGQSDIVIPGDSVDYTITVTNYGSGAALNQEVFDYFESDELILSDTDWTLVEAGKAKYNTLLNLNPGESIDIDITFTVAPNAQGTIINLACVGSEDDPDCVPDPCDLTPDGLCCDETHEDYDADGCEPIHTPDVVLIKELAVGQSDIVIPGDSVDYTITVTNYGSGAALNQEVFDYFESDELILSDTDWTLVEAGKAKYNTLLNLNPGESIDIDITFTVAPNAQGTIINLACVGSEDDPDCVPDPCDLTPDGLCCDETHEDYDPDGCEPIKVPSIDIDKTDANTDFDQDGNIGGNDSQTIDYGDKSVFKIRVTNDGAEDLTSIVLSDTQAPNCAGSVTLPDTYPSTWSNFTTGGSGSLTNNILEIGEWFEYTCEKDNTTANYTNTAIVDALGVISGKAVDDSDTSVVQLVGVTSACTNLSASPTSAQNSLTSTLTCTGSGTISSYLIEVTNSSNSVVFSSSGSLATVTLNTTGSYTARCFVNGETTTPNSCQKTLNVTDDGGGLSPVCNDVLQSGDQVTCVGNRKVKAFMLVCGTGVDAVKLFDNTPDIINSKRREATFTCAASAECLVNEDPKTTDDGTWIARGSDVCKTTKTPFCGDGVLDSEAGEKCDFGTPYTADRWGKCYLPGDSRECTLRGGGGDSDSCDPKKEICNIITLPDDGSLVFGPAGNVIVGHGMNPLDQVGSPYLENNSEYDLSFDKFCVKRMSSDSVGSEKALSSGNAAGEYCINIGHDIIYGGERIELQDYAVYPNFLGNKNGIPNVKDFGESVLKTSIKDDIDNDGSIDELYDSYLSSQLDVRIAKPAVVTVGGGTSYIKKSESTGDVNATTSGISGFDQTNNKNFVGVSVSDSGVSSYSDSIDSTNTDVVDATEADKTEYEKAVDTVTDTTPTTGNTIGYGDFTNYNGLDNVYIISGKNVTLSSIPSLSKSTTYIIEGGNLKIMGDMISNQNVAFVVKGGDIIIDKNVDTIDGTYISIPTATGGKIKGNGDTSVQLVVKGSLYGNISELVMSRHYISNDNGQLSVGTIVSFGSSLFTKPAPLVSQFIGEYLEAEKVAR